MKEQGETKEKILVIQKKKIIKKVRKSLYEGLFFIF